MEALAAQIHATQTVETSSLALAVARERAHRFMVAWQQALKALAHRASPPESYIQMTSTAVAVGDPEASQTAAQRLLDLTPRLFTTQRRVRVPKRTFNFHRKPRKKVNSIPCPASFTPNRKPRQSICMIVRNEERFLGQCLASVKDIADELIVIDTGSTDRTVEIAREHGAQVGHFEWCNNFAAARNASIAPATGDWILFLDADEELSPIEKQNLPALLNSNNVALIRLPLINKHQGPISKSILPRLYRNIPTIQFQGCVHEEVYTDFLKISKEWQMKICLGDLLISHNGYTAEVISQRNKIQRNYERLVKALEERPNEACFYMQLGLELRRMDRLAKSFDAYLKALNLAETQPEQIITDEVCETLLTQYSEYLLADKQYEKVLEVLTSDLALRQLLTPGQLLVRGRALIHLRQPKFELKDVQEAFFRREEAILFPSAIDPMGGATEALLAEGFYLNSQFQEAIKWFEKVLQTSHPELRVVLAYSECLDAFGKTTEALEFLRQKALSWNNSPNIWIHGAKLVIKHAELKEVSQAWLVEAQYYHPNLKMTEGVL